jgi:hypothetical protein
MVLTYFPNDFEMVPVAPIITGITIVFTFLQAPNQGSTVGGLLYVSPPEEDHERRTFFRLGGNPRTCDSGSAIDS